MSFYQTGIDGTNACLLIAMHDMFDDGMFDVSEGLAFLQDVMADFNFTGFPSQYNYLIEESLPVISFTTAHFTACYHQTYPYLIIYNRDTNVRYRILRDEPIAVSYAVEFNKGHVVTIPAHMFNILMADRENTFIALFVRKNGIIIDNVSYEYDLERRFISGPNN